MITCSICGGEMSETGNSEAWNFITHVEFACHTCCVETWVPYPTLAEIIGVTGNVQQSEDPIFRDSEQER